MVRIPALVYPSPQAWCLLFLIYKVSFICLFALIILSGHFIIIGTIVVIWAFGRDIDDVIKILSTVGALLGSPLGFVIGYYYKDKSK